MPSRELSFPVFDADNHMYKPQATFDQVLPGQAQERHRLRASSRSHQDRRLPIIIHPQPDGQKVAKPGAQEDYFLNGAQGKTYRGSWASR